MLKKISLISLITMVLLLAGCSNEKGNNLYIGVEGSNALGSSLGQIIRDDQLTLINNLYKGLFEVSEDNKVIPVLVESFTYSEDGRIITLNIKEGFMWSDNTPITAENVVSGLKNNIANDQGKFSYQYKYLDRKVEDNIRVNEDKQVEIYLSKEFTDFEKVLAMPIFYPVLNTEDPLVGPFSGDFVVEKKTKDKIILAPRDKEKAITEKKTESVVFEYSLGKEKLLKGFQAKDYDVIFPETAIEEAKGEKIKAPALELLWLNGRSEDLEKLEGRKAIYQNLEKIDGIYPSRYRDESKFEKIIMKSEYTFNNPQLKLLILDGPKSLKTGEKIKEQLSKKLNLNIEVLAKPVDEYYASLREGDFDLALETWEGDYHGKNAYFEVFRNPLYNPLNASGINIPAINDLQNQINRIADSPEREIIFKDLEKKIVESVSAVVLSEGLEKESYIQRVKNVGLNSIYNYHDYSNIKY